METRTGRGIVSAGNLDPRNVETMKTAKPTAADTARRFLDDCRADGWRVDVQGQTVTIGKHFTPGDRMHTTRGGFTVSRIVWPDNWRQPVELEPLPLELLDALAPAEYRLPSAHQGPPSVFPGGRVYHGSARVTTNGAAPVRRNGADWLRCRLELWDGEGSRQLLRGLIRVDR